MFIKINNAKLFFDTYGSELKLLPDRVLKKPTVIVLHGLHGFFDHTLYVEFWSQFQDLAQIIFIDQHGHLDASKAFLALYTDPNEENWRAFAKHWLPHYAKNI